MLRKLMYICVYYSPKSAVMNQSKIICSLERYFATISLLLHTKLAFLFFFFFFSKFKYLNILIFQKNVENWFYIFKRKYLTFYFQINYFWNLKIDLKSFLHVRKFCGFFSCFPTFFVLLLKCIFSLVLQLSNSKKYTNFKVF